MPTTKTLVSKIPTEQQQMWSRRDDVCRRCGLFSQFVTSAEEPGTTKGPSGVRQSTATAQQDPLTTYSTTTGHGDLSSIHNPQSTRPSTACYHHVRVRQQWYHCNDIRVPVLSNMSLSTLRYGSFRNGRLSSRLLSHRPVLGGPPLRLDEDHSPHLNNNSSSNNNSNKRYIRKFWR